MRTWRKTYAHLDEQAVTAELGAWLREPRSNDEIRERVRPYEGVTKAWKPIIFARTLLALVQLPPAGFWRDSAARASSPTRDRCPTRTTPPRSCSSATSPPSARPAAATSPRGRASRSATSPTPSTRRDRLLPRRARHRAARPPRRAAAAGRHAAAAALPRALGPGAARLRRPRPDHPARAAAAEAHAVGRSDAHRRRPRRRELAASTAAEGGEGADRAPPESAAPRTPRSSPRPSGPPASSPRTTSRWRWRARSAPERPKLRHLRRCVAQARGCSVA